MYVTQEIFLTVTHWKYFLIIGLITTRLWRLGTWQFLIQWPELSSVAISLKTIELYSCSSRSHQYIVNEGFYAQRATSMYIFLIALHMGCWMYSDNGGRIVSELGAEDLCYQSSDLIVTLRLLRPAHEYPLPGYLHIIVPAHSTDDKRRISLRWWCGSRRIRRREKLTAAQNWRFKEIRVKYWACIIQ